MNLPQYPRLTEDVVKSTEWRAELVYTLQEIREELRGVNNNVSTGRAEAANASIRIRNRLINPNDLSPVQKTVPGSGIELARTLAPDHASRTAIDQFATNNPEFTTGAIIGSIPPFFDPSIGYYEHLEFLKLILFYNEDMEIVAGSGISDRRSAMRNWLITF